MLCNILFLIEYIIHKNQELDIAFIVYIKYYILMGTPFKLNKIELWSLQNIVSIILPFLKAVAHKEMNFIIWQFSLCYHFKNSVQIRRGVLIYPLDIWKSTMQCEPRIKRCIVAAFIACHWTSFIKMSIGFWWFEDWNTTYISGSIGRIYCVI